MLLGLLSAYITFNKGTFLWQFQGEGEREMGRRRRTLIKRERLCFRGKYSTS